MRNQRPGSKDSWLQTVITVGNFDNPWPPNKALCGGVAPDANSKMFVGLSPYATWTVSVDPAGSAGEQRHGRRHEAGKPKSGIQS